MIPHSQFLIAVPPAAYPACAVVGAYLLLCFVVAPLVVWLVSWQSREPRIIPREPERTAADAYFDVVFPPLADRGFRNAARFSFGDFTPRVQAELCILTDPGRRAVATALVISVNSGGGFRIHSSSLEFGSVTEDGRLLNTTNVPVLLPYTRLGKKWMVPMTIVQDPVRLLAVHEALVAREFPGARLKSPPAPEELPAKITESIRTDLDEQVRLGLLRDVPGKSRCRFTLRGAFVNTWKMIWPVTVVRRRRRDRRSRDLLRQLGLSG